MSSANRESLAPFPICVPSLFFLSRIAPSSAASSTALKRNGHRGQSCLIPDFGGIAKSSSPCRMMLTIGFSYIASIVLGHLLTSPPFSYYEGMLDFVKHFFWYLLR